MTIDNYLSQPENDRKTIVNEVNVNASPFWLCQLHLAVKNLSPIGLNFLDKRLGSEYWVLISKN